MNLGDAKKVIAPAAARECTPFPASLNKHKITILKSLLTSMDGQRTMHRIIVQKDDGSIVLHYAPSFYGQGASLQIEEFFTHYPNETLDCVPRIVGTDKNNRPVWELHPVPTPKTENSTVEPVLTDEDMENLNSDVTGEIPF